MGNQTRTGPTRLVSVKFDAVGRTHTFLLPDIDFEPRLKPADAVVVQTGERRAFGTIALTVPELAKRKAPRDTSAQVLRRATRSHARRDRRLARPDAADAREQHRQTHRLLMEYARLLTRPPVSPERVAEAFAEPLEPRGVDSLVVARVQLEERPGASVVSSQ